MWLYRAIFSLACRTHEEHQAAQSLYHASRNDPYTQQRILKWQNTYAYLSRTPLFSSTLARLKKLCQQQSSVRYFLDEMMSQDLQKLNQGKPFSFKGQTFTFHGLAYHARAQPELVWAPTLIERMAHFATLYPTLCHPIAVAVIHPLHAIPDDVLLRLYNQYTLEEDHLHFGDYVNSYLRSRENFGEEGQIVSELASKMQDSLLLWESNPHAEEDDLIQWLSQSYHFHPFHIPHLRHFIHTNKLHNKTKAA